MALYAFNSSNIQSWPIPGFTTKWFSEAWHDQEVRDALWLSLRAGLCATADRARARLARRIRSRRARGSSGATRSRSSFILPIALPGIITGLALNSFFVIWGAQLLALDDRDRARDVLRRDRLQQRDRPAAADVGLVLRGVGRSRRDRVPDVPVRDAARDRHGARRRRPARVRALLGRDRRHVLHRRRAEHAAAAALRLHPPGAEPADRERDRARRDRRQRSSRSALAQRLAGPTSRRDEAKTVGMSSSRELAGRDAMGAEHRVE